MIENKLFTAPLTEEQKAIIENAIQKGSYMKAPNGEVSKLSPTQWVQVRTDAFKKWFGDWENEPESASKVIDENGEPMVVFHGTGDHFTIFSTKKTATPQFWFTNRKDLIDSGMVGAARKGFVMPVFLNIKNPSGWDEEDRLVQQQIMDRGFDGKDLTDGDIKTFVTFEPNQVKSAIENTGAYSLENDDIRFRFIGEKGATALDLAEEATTRLDNLVIAREMEVAERDSKVIKLATGWERGADNKWRYETGDGQVNKDVHLFTSFGNTYTCMLGELYDDDSLFDAYPQLGGIGVEFTNTGNTLGSFDGLTIKLDRGYIANGKFHPNAIIDYDKDRVTYLPLRSVLIHEVQHAIQYIEGFAKGGNPEYFKQLDKLAGATEYDQNLYDFNSLVSDVIGAEPYKRLGEILNEERFKAFRESLDDLQKESIKTLVRLYRTMPEEAFMSNYNYSLEKAQESRISPEKKYHRISGEVEARNVQSRMDMSPEERRNSLAIETEDISRADQIFLNNSLNTQMSMLTESEQNSIISAINEYSNELHTPIRIVSSIEELPLDSNSRKHIEAGEQIKAWFDINKNETVIYLPHVDSISDVRRSIYHEVVAHYGLRELYGQHFDNFLDNVFQNASPEIQTKILSLTNGDSSKLREAVEEYLANLAEKGFSSPTEFTFWEKIKSAFIDMLRQAGVFLGFKLNDNDFRSILHTSYQNLKEGIKIISPTELEISQLKSAIKEIQHHNDSDKALSEIYQPFYEKYGDIKEEHKTFRKEAKEYFNQQYDNQKEAYLKKLNSEEGAKELKEVSDEMLASNIESIQKKTNIDEWINAKTAKAIGSDYKDPHIDAPFTRAVIDNIAKDSVRKELLLPVFLELQNQRQQAKNIPVLTEEEYLASKGFDNHFGDPALHKGRQKSTRLQNKLVERQALKDQERLIKRAELRKDFQEKLNNGELREPSNVEKLIKAANGHPDLESTMAARRALAKRGVNWSPTNHELQSTGARTLIGDFTAGKDSQMTNFRIHDKSTGKTESFNTNGIDLSKESPATLKKILSGGKANTSSGLLQLSKTSLGWGLTVVKQLFSTVDTSAEI